MPAPPLPTSIDQAYIGTSNKLDFDIQYFGGPTTTEFLMGTTDTDMNFDWVSSNPIE